MRDGSEGQERKKEMKGAKRKGKGKVLPFVGMTADEYQDWLTKAYIDDGWRVIKVRNQKGKRK